MVRFYTPAELALEFNVSTTTLRRYEEQGLLPHVARSTGGHRQYASLHRLAFAAIRSMLVGFEIPVVYEVMRSVKNGNVTEALWQINQQLHRIQEEKIRVGHVLGMVQQAQLGSYQKMKTPDGPLPIGKAAELAGVNTSAIRHWEKEGLIVSIRDKENGYRLYDLTELRKILVISSLRRTVYYVDHLRELLSELEAHQFERIDRSFQLALAKLSERLQAQLEGIRHLMGYIEAYRQHIHKEH